jgi:hypothetical protein
MTDRRSHSTKHESNQPQNSTALRVERSAKRAGRCSKLNRQQHDLNHTLTKIRILEHRGTRTLRLRHFSHTTERMVKGNATTTSLKNVWTLRQYPATCYDHAFPRIIYYNLSDHTRNYISSSAETMSLNGLKSRITIRSRGKNYDKPHQNSSINLRNKHQCKQAPFCY